METHTTASTESISFGCIWPNLRCHYGRGDVCRTVERTFPARPGGQSQAKRLPTRSLGGLTQRLAGFATDILGRSYLPIAAAASRPTTFSCE